MEEFILSIAGSTTKLPFKLTYGIQKDLQTYLVEDNNLYSMLTDPGIAEYVYKLCLSTRNDQGQIVDEFTAFDTLNVMELNVLLDTIFDYFENFFLSRQERIKTAVTKLNNLNPPS